MIPFPVVLVASVVVVLLFVMAVLSALVSASRDDDRHGRPRG